MDQRLSDTVMELRRAHRRMRWALAGAGVIAFFGWAWPAQSDTFVPHTFVANRPARASEINANFQAMADGINANLRRIEALEGRGDFVPAGTIAFFAADACPSGWDRYDAANGRYVVVAPSGGTVGGTVAGTSPLSDLEDRAHQHTISHRHTWASYGAPGSILPGWWGFVQGSEDFVAFGNPRYEAGDDDPFRPMSSHGVSRVFHTSYPQNAAGANVTHSGEASAASIAPYIQLRACSKS